MADDLISRSFRVYPYMACFSFRNMTTAEEMLRALRPEARIRINGKTYRGRRVQFEYAYIRRHSLDKFKDDTTAFQLKDFTVRNIRPRFPWTPVTNPLKGLSGSRYTIRV